MSSALDMDELEFEGECFLLQVKQARVLDILQFSVSKYF